MNKTKIEWCDYTWNPVNGCRHGCAYCYARTIAERFVGTKAFPNGFEPSFYPERLTEPAKVKSPSIIFAVSMGDLGGSWVDPSHVRAVFRAMTEAKHHRYVVLTKGDVEWLSDAARYEDITTSVHIGISITGRMDDHEAERLEDLSMVRKNRVLSLEPMLAAFDPERIRYYPIDWLIIGGQTGATRVQPKPEWIEPLVQFCRSQGVPVFVKDNCGYPERVREFPATFPLEAVERLEGVRS